MRDLIVELEEARRRVGTGTLSGAKAHVVELRRTYAAPVEDVWSACTDPTRVGRWFLPLSGDLKPGGRYQLEGNAGGEILRCEPPHGFGLTWVIGEQSSLLAVDLTPLDDGGTELRLQHTVPDDEHWATFGPGAVGVGWDLGALGLLAFLEGEPVTDPAGFARSPEALAFMRRSAAEWGQAHEASGVPAEEARGSAERTRDAYAPTARPEGSS